MEVFLRELVFVLSIMEYVCFFKFFYRRNIRETKEKNIALVLMVVLMALVYFLANNYDKLLLFCIVFSYVFVYLLFEVTFKRSLLLFFLAFGMVCILETLSEFFIRYLGMKNDLYYSLFYLSVDITVMFLYYIIVGRKIDKDAFILPPRLNLIYGIVTYIMVAMISFYTYLILDVKKHKQSTVGITLILVGGVTIFILSLWLIYNYNLIQRYKMDNIVLEKFNEQQKDYFNNLIEREKNTRKFRHDINAQLVQLYEYAQNDDMNNINLFLKDMIKELSDIKNSGYNVGNEIVNTMLNYYLLPKKNEFEINVKGYIGEGLKIGKRDLCIVISNLLKNSVEAVEKITDGEKKIDFEIKSKDTHVFVKVINSVKNIKDIKINNNMIMTDKKDKANHGFGLFNISNAVNRNNGMIKMYCNNNYVVTEIFIS
ncbi:Sensor histidine kinase YesM [Lachnospiraceae bacterium RM5]|nr:Sensor histidine kinase YesM [Lachnospiraceae bacterium RM5]